ncbi:MAG: hypothetical protein EBU90_20305 [Proteobacteria bacterium]|nr:hypothetical protein [Pseudomonadota bacterium]NBP15941.1 hypothetical protein [bacterium]
MHIYINRTHRGGSILINKSTRGKSTYSNKSSRLGGSLLISKDLGNSKGGSLLVSKNLGGFGTQNNPIVENTKALTNKLEKLSVKNSNKKNIRFQI